MRLKLREESGAEQTIELPQPFAIVGRDADCDLRLDLPDVSGRHAYLQVLDGRVLAIDLESRTQLHWERGPRAQGWLEATDPVRVGRTWIEPLGALGRERDLQSALPTERHTGRAGHPVGLLDFAERGSWRINRRLVLIGRSPQCRVRLPDLEVSRFHCTVVQTEQGPWIVDLLSRSGTLVNGAQVRFAPLFDGDEIQIGPHRIHYRGQDQSAGRSLAVSPPRRSPRPASEPAGSASKGALVTTVPGGTSLLPLPLPEGLDATVAPLLREFGLMQQQMADQFQQALMMMFRMFCDMHQDQSTLIREELAQIRALTEEQQALRAELARRGATPTAPAMGGAPSGLRLVGGEPGPSPSAVPAPPRTESPRRPTPVTAGARHEAASRPEPAAPLAEDVAAPETDAKPRRPASAVSEPEPVDLHSQLVSRLAQIENERQGRWQRLVGSLMGKGAAPDAP